MGGSLLMRCGGWRAGGWGVQRQRPLQRHGVVLRQARCLLRELCADHIVSPTSHLAMAAEQQQSC